MNGRDRFRPVEPGRADAHGLTEDLARQLSTLTDILDSVDDEAQLMDASLDDTHDIVSCVGRLVKHRIFGSDGPLPASEHPDIYVRFVHARADESDVYEVYADDLERHQKRRRKDLTITDSDSDKFAVVKRRRTYIAILFDLHTQISGIVDRLRTR